jgi:hypothetical protein
MMMLLAKNVDGAKQQPAVARVPTPVVLFGASSLSQLFSMPGLSCTHPGTLYAHTGMVPSGQNTKMLVTKVSCCTHYKTDFEHLDWVDFVFLI